MMRYVSLAVLALAAAVPAEPVGGQAFAAAPRWNPKAPENSQLLPAFSYATIEPVLASIGARGVRGGAPGKPALSVTFANGRKALLQLSSCDPQLTGCKALSIQSYWTRIANSPPERTAQAIQSFNQRLAFAKAFIAPDGRPALQRYLTADFGFIRGDLAVNLLVFSTQAEQFATTVLGPLEAVKR
jgi:hypothetical protein